MRLFGGEKMKRIMSSVGMKPGEPIDHPWLNKSIEKAQKKVEERNFEIRKNLLDYDDVLNQQRNFIYQQRDSILADDDLSTRVMNNARETVSMIFDEFRANKKDPNAQRALSDKIHDTFGQTLNQEQLTEEGLTAVLQNDITQKEMLVGKPNFNMFIRYQYIQMIDKKWLDQLEYLDGLREAVYLRSYGSKNPLTEYKNDGFDQFDVMLDSIRDSVASRIFKVKVQTKTEEQQKRRLEPRMQMNAQHEEAQSAISPARSAQQAFNARQAQQGAANTGMKSGRQGQSVTVARTVPKVGRNDPCPCGSGKKYKNCCGR